MKQPSLENIKAYVDKKFVFCEENVLAIGAKGILEQLKEDDVIKNYHLTINDLKTIIKDYYEIPCRQK